MADACTRGNGWSHGLAQAGKFGLAMMLAAMVGRGVVVVFHWPTWMGVAAYVAAFGALLWGAVGVRLSRGVFRPGPADVADGEVVRGTTPEGRDAWVVTCSCSRDEPHYFRGVWTEAEVWDRWGQHVQAGHCW